MSAFTVTKAHIDVLVNLAFKYGLITGAKTMKTGQMLWDENYSSVNYRYQLDNFAPRYEFTAARVEFAPVAVYKLLECYIYQSCEHSGWERSEAQLLCERLKELLGVNPHDPHYDRMPWEVGSLDDVPQYKKWISNGRIE